MTSATEKWMRFHEVPLWSSDFWTAFPRKLMLHRRNWHPCLTWKLGYFQLWEWTCWRQVPCPVSFIGCWSHLVEVIMQGSTVEKRSGFPRLWGPVQVRPAPSVVGFAREIAVWIKRVILQENGCHNLFKTKCPASFTPLMAVCAPA